MIYDYDPHELLPKLMGPLKELLFLELSSGNEIVEIADSWPRPQVNVWLKNPLGDKYREKFPQLEYNYLGDRKNWIEDYSDHAIGAMVAVKY